MKKCAGCRYRTRDRCLRSRHAYDRATVPGTNRQKNDEDTIQFVNHLLIAICIQEIVKLKMYLTFLIIRQNYLSPVMRKPAFCICENKGTDQLHGNRAAHQRLCFTAYTAQSLAFCFLNPKFQASSHLLWFYSLVCVEPGQKPQRQTFSRHVSFLTYRN